VIIFYSVAENYNLTEMRDNVICFIRSRFIEISNTRHFNFLPYERLAFILSDDRLNVATELEVFYAAMRWVNFNREERVCLLSKILRDIVRLHFISPESLVRNVEPLMLDLPDCAAAVGEVLR